MKNLMIITLFCLTSFVAKSEMNTNPMSIVSSHDGFLYLKFNKTTYGGVLEVKDQNDSVVFHAAVDQKHVLVDFFSLQSGKYTVTFVKDDFKMSFSYILVDDSKPVDEKEVIAAVAPANTNREF